MLLLLWLSAACSQTDAVSAELAKLVAGTKPAAGAAPAVWPDVQTFYASREHEPAWVDDRKPTSRAREALDVLRRAQQHGLTPADYNEPGLTSTEAGLQDVKDAEDRTRLLAEFDARLTAALLSLGRDVALGRNAHRSRKPASQRTAPDVPASLAAATGDLDGWLDTLRPPHPEYAALQQGLADLYAQADRGESPADPPIETRIKQVQRNLDRWRALPDDLGERHFLVNIPEYHLYAREGGRVVLDMKVVVGTPETKTPVFSDEMETVVFSPYWNIPDTIVVGETAPAIARDPNYMRRNQIEILRRTDDGVSRVDPSDVDWDNPDALKQLAFRQKPGAHNALGHVKFLFPNQYNVYLHDTPSDSLFARQGRAFSHGCVRVEQPEELAQYVLRHDSSWTPERIREAMLSGTEKHVKLDTPIPVHLVYFTVMPGPDGQLNFFRDIYGLD